jgi:hypothetical protein
MDSPDLAAAVFYPFRQLQSAMRGRRFCDATDIVKNATEDLKRLSLKGCQECFHLLHRHWLKCIFALGDYFEEK